MIGTSTGFVRLRTGGRAFLTEPDSTSRGILWTPRRSGLSPAPPPSAVSGGRRRLGRGRWRQRMFGRKGFDLIGVECREKALPDSLDELRLSGLQQQTVFFRKSAKIQLAAETLGQHAVVPETDREIASENLTLLFRDRVAGKTALSLSRSASRWRSRSGKGFSILPDRIPLPRITASKSVGSGMLCERSTATAPGSSLSKRRAALAGTAVPLSHTN